MSTPKISIIIPVYNTEKYLPDLFASLLAQDCDKDDYEIIFVNDGSTDESYNLLQKFKADNQQLNISLFTEENAGQSAARNLGMKYAGANSGGGMFGLLTAMT